ncbi:hypothetical protein LZP69_04455 [Shewanella sp. AS1]|uniref:hypothetical protein n=1 Tax=Shewanella sp. AS1 TaxID=2907626 RepID=UPI001F260797|nr:hypothetical protein [Shewanella sp. AS1]MCE9678450.1 hypothetical protein [Shewanella sp. AS1]
MPSVEQVAYFIVLVAASYLIGLGLAAFIHPKQISRFLLAFASSLKLHLIEIGLRLIVGAALLGYAPQMRFSAGFTLFAWILIWTSIALILLPWRWHRAFAQKAVPLFTRQLPILGLGSLVLGGVILGAML